MFAHHKPVPPPLPPDSVVNHTQHDNYRNIVDKEIVIPDRIRFGNDFLGGHLDLLLGGRHNPGMLVGGSYLLTGQQNSGKTTATMQIGDALTGEHTTLYHNREMIESEMELIRRRVPLPNGFGLRASDSGIDTLNPVQAAEMAYRVAEGLDLDDTPPEKALMRDFIETCELRNAERAANNLRAEQYNNIVDISSPNVTMMPSDEGRVILIIDSIQALAEGCSELELVNRFIKITQYMGGVVIFIGQATKTGRAAGTNKIPHAVTAHLHLKVVTNDGENNQIREWKVEKNRGGPTGRFYTKLARTGHRYITEREMLAIKGG
jgi:predicted ATP-dependent serine protease